jgi:dTDP-glucose 4,6-dehydratase
MLTTKIKKVNFDLSAKELNHTQTISLEEGIKKTVDWMKEYYKLH